MDRRFSPTWLAAMFGDWSRRKNLQWEELMSHVTGLKLQHGWRHVTRKKVNGINELYFKCTELRFGDL